MSNMLNIRQILDKLDASYISALIPLRRLVLMQLTKYVEFKFKFQTYMSEITNMSNIKQILDKHQINYISAIRQPEGSFGVEMIS